MITPVIVSPDKSNIIPLAPEYITPQDGHLKQDCENMAGKRWLKARGSKLLSKLRLADLSLGITILGDDLYSRQPICIELLKAGFNFILVCKEESHPYLYQWVKDLETGEDKDQKHQLITKRWTGKFHEVTTYHFANNIPLKEGKEALRVSWCQVTVTREETGKQLYHNGFVVSRTISQENIVEVILGGRARWKVENENNNTLKTKGYHLEHNFGHGKKYLATLLAAFTLISFLFHTVMDLTDTLYQSLRARLGSRENFFNGIKQLTTFMYFRGWEHMFNFMIEGLKRRHLAPG
jgi:hypothetical protein